MANLSLQYVNYMSCMVISRCGGFLVGVVIWMAYDAHYVGFKPSVAFTSLSIAYIHGSSHDGTVFLGVFHYTFLHSLMYSVLLFYLIGRVCIFPIQLFMSFCY